MALSSDLISQFVQATNDTPVTKSESTVYGTTVEYDGATYVKLDGSDLLTPVNTTTATEPGERVTVLIKDHTATITGNMSSPSARNDDVLEIGNQITAVEILVADKVSTKELDAVNGRIENLVSENVTIRGELDANKATIESLVAKDAEITGTLTANKADIDSLQVNKLDAEIANIKYATIEDLNAMEIDVRDLEATFGEFEVLNANKFTAIDATIKNLDAEMVTTEHLEANYANIDFANIGDAAIENFFAKSGMVEDAVISNGTITGTLVGVTIKGDLIEGGTIVADKLVVKGEDGLYYKLNTDGVSIEAEQTEYNSINGSIITAQSITATKICVDDLVAFDATIGGFTITDNAIHSNVKTTVGNTTRGIYMDNDGQMAIGDATHYLKYYKDTDGKYKLAISAESIKFSSSEKTVEEEINELRKDFEDSTDVGALTTRITTAEAAIEQNTKAIALKASQEYVEETFDGYYTKEETDAALQVTSNSITTSVSKTYATKSDASAAQAAADQAKADAAVAKTAADQAAANAVSAQSKADQAATEAANAKASAVEANNKLTQAQADLETAKQNLETVTGRVDATEEEIAAAQKAVTDAQNRADQAAANATNAQKAADDAKTNADAAQEVANQAKNDAENAQNAADIAQTNANEAYKIAEDASGRVTTAESNIQQLADMISTLVTDGNGVSVMKQTADGWTFCVGDINNSIAQNSKDVSDLSGKVDAANTTMTGLKQTIDDLGELTDYVVVTTYNSQPCVELGEADSDFKLRITNTEMQFMDGTAIPAYVSNKKLMIEQAEVKDELQFGNFVWKIRKNGNMGLMWKGGAS